MFNLIRMDLYRLRHTMSTYVMIVTMVLFSLFSVYMIKMDLDLIEENGYETSDTEDVVNIGIYVENNPQWLTEPADIGELVCTNLNSGMLMAFCAIFAAVFVSAEQKSGFVKNIAGQVSGRGLLALSKLCAVAVQVLLILLLFTVLTGIFGQLMLPEGVHVSSFAGTAKMLGLQYLLHFAFTGVILFLCIWLRNSAAAIAVGIVVSCNVTVIIYGFINTFLHKLFGIENANIGQYSLEQNVGAVTMNTDGDIMTRAILVGAVFLIAGVAGAMLLMQKRDVK